MALRIFNQRITSCSRLYFRFVDPAYQFSFSKRSYRFSDCNVISSCFSKNVFSFSTSVQKPESCADIEVTFIRASGERIKVKGKKGDSLLDVIINNNLDFDAFGACEGTLTCSTCHVILKKVDYDRLPEKPTDEELDMLDLAHGLTDTSRLGCQIILTEDLNELEVEVPATVNDARER